MATISDDLLLKMSTYPPFFQKVWKACAAIPAGETRTYGELAREIGHPKASRAVGMALGANPFAPTIPCHRVIRSDGSMGGYSAAGGIATKLRMLRREGAKFPLKRKPARAHT